MDKKIIILDKMEQSIKKIKQMKIQRKNKLK